MDITKFLLHLVHSAKKDANGNYWLINKANDTLIGIWSENVKMGANSVRKGLSTRSYGYTPDISDGKDHYFATGTSDAGIKDGSAYTIAGISTDDVNAFSDDIFADTYYLNSVGATWDAHVSSSHNEVYFTLSSAYSGYAYQQSLNGKQNIWMPFGMKDDGGNSQTSYELLEDKLDDSYFLNCYIE